MCRTQRLNGENPLRSCMWIRVYKSCIKIHEVYSWHDMEKKYIVNHNRNMICAENMCRKCIHQFTLSLPCRNSLSLKMFAHWALNNKVILMPRYSNKTCFLLGGEWGLKAPCFLPSAKSLLRWIPRLVTVSNCNTKPWHLNQSLSYLSGWAMRRRQCGPVAYVTFKI